MNAAATVDDVVGALDADGYAIVEGLLPPGEAASARAELTRLLAAIPEGRNPFEGFNTRRIYALFNAEDHLYSVQFQAPHNYNKDSREAMYSWMARWLQHAPADVHVNERPFAPERLSDLLVFEGRSLPEGALSAEQVTGQWIEMAGRQLNEASSQVLQSSLLHALWRCFSSP